MTYTFKVDRENGTWTCENPNGQQVDSGNLPLTDSRRMAAIIEDKGVSSPVKDAMKAIFERDWETKNAGN